MQEINVNELKPHPKNDYFFDDITGENWDAFLESIKTSGVIEPIIVDAKTKTIVSGHQRIRACKELDIEKILCEVRIYDSADKLVKDLLETNLRQRGIGNTNSIKLGRCLRELERIYGVRQGSSNPKGTNVRDLDNTSDITQEQIAQQYNISIDKYRNAEKLLNLIPELQDMVQDNKLSSTVASRILARLSPTDQQQLIITYGKDEIEKATQKQTQDMVEEMTQLKNINAGLQIKIKNKENEMINAVSNATSKLNKEISELNSEKSLLERKVKLNQEDADKYSKLKSDIKFLTQQKTDLSRRLTSSTELAELTVQLQHVLEKDLSPIKYKRCMEVLDSSDVAMENLIEVITSVENWVKEIKGYLPRQEQNVIDANYIEIKGE